MRRFSVALLLSAVLSIAVFCTGCTKDDAAGAGAPRRGPQSVPVYVASVEVRKLAPRVIVVGTVTPRRKSIVASGADGVVQSYSVEEGEWVEKDTVLSQLRMESSKRVLAQAKALADQYHEEWKETGSFRKEEIAEVQYRKEAAETLWDTAKNKLDRAEKARKSGAINKDELDEAVEREKQTKALFFAAGENHKRMIAGPRQEKRFQAKYKLDAQQEFVAFLNAEAAKRITKAPFAGFVVKEHSYIGQWLSKGAPVATIAMLDEVDVVVNVDQSDIRHVRIGTGVSVRIPGLDLVSIKTKDAKHIGLIFTESTDDVVLFDEKGEIQKPIRKTDIVERHVSPWMGRVVQIVPQSDWQTGSRGFPVKVRITNWFRRELIVSDRHWDWFPVRKLPVLKEGLMAAVTFEGTAVRKFLVPKDALVRSTSGLKIHIFTPGKDSPKKGSTMWMGVKTGLAVGNLIEVIPQPSNKGEPTTLTEKTQIVIEGGENLRPVQGDVVIKDKTVTRKE